MMVSSSGHITLCASVEERVVDLRCCVKYPVVACANAQDERPVAEGQVPRDVCERQWPHLKVRTLIYYPLTFVVLLIDLNQVCNEMWD